MLPITWDTIRITLHILAATIWVGGQLTLAALVPIVRRAAPDVTRLVARRFGALAWLAFGVLALTGVWNVSEEWDEVEGDYRTTLIVKLVLVAGSGISAWAHQQATTPRGLAIFGALSGQTAVAAVFFGVLL